MPLIPRHAGGGGEVAVEAPWWTAAVEWWIAATGDVGAGAAAAAEWDDSGEHDYMSLGCSPTHLAVPLFLVSTTVLVNRKVFL